jgi:hypothetical protein
MARSASVDKTVREWDPQTGSMSSVNPFEDRVTGLAISQDGNSIVVGLEKDHVEQAALGDPRDILEQPDIGVMAANP